MDLDYFKDVLFDLINECDLFELSDIRTDERRNTIHVVLQSGIELEVTIRQVMSSSEN